MTLEEVAKYLKLKPQTIYTWAQDGKIPAAKLGKEWRFKKSIIDNWQLILPSVSGYGSNLLIVMLRGWLSEVMIAIWHPLTF